MANADANTTMGNAQPTVLHAASVASRITGLSNVEVLGVGTVQPVTHPPREGHKDRGGSAPSRKAGDMEEAAASRNLLPIRSQGKAVANGKPFKTSALTVTGLPIHNTLPKLLVWEEPKQRRL